MNKIIKTCSIFALGFLSILTATSCGKKTTKEAKTTNNTTKTTAKPATSKEKKVAFHVKTTNNLDGASYKLYNVVDGIKTLVNNDYEFKKDDKVVIEIINRSTSNASIKASIGDSSVIDQVVKTKSQKELEEITITDDINLEINSSNLYYIDFNNTDSVTFKAYYFDSNNVKQEFDDDFTVDKKTKIYFSMSNDSTGANIGYIKKGNEYLDYVICKGKGGHAPVEGDFDSEGFDIESNIVLTSYHVDGYSEYFDCGLYLADGVTLTCVNAKTEEAITIDPESWSNDVDRFIDTIITISNPDKKHLVIGIESVDGLQKIDSSDETITINYTFNSDTYIEVEEYAEYTLSLINNNKDIITKLYTIDSDNIKVDLNNGKYPIYTPYYFELENTTKYDVTLAITLYDMTRNFTVHAYESFDFSTLVSNVYLFDNVAFVVTKTDVETKFYTVVYDGDTIPEGLRLGINRGMYDYPDVEFGSDIVSGTQLVAVCEYQLNGRTLKVIDVATNEVVKQDSIGGSCAIPFTLNGNYKIIVE